MGKKARTRDKLDLILSELQKLKSEVKALGRQHADLAAIVEKLKPAKVAASRPAQKRAKPRAKPTSATPTRKAATAPKRPVLVSSPSTAAG